MTAATRARHEPEENEFLQSEGSLDEAGDAYGRLLQSLLNQIEDGLKRAIEHDLVSELRQVLAKFPEVLPEANKQKEPAPQPATGATVPKPARYDIDLMLGLSNAAHRLDDHARRAKPDSANQRADASCAAFLRAEIAKLKGGTPA